MNKATVGFTLIELLVVITIIGLLSSVLYIKVSEGSAQSRDAERKADLRNIQAALELYKNREGRYPEGCRGPGVWSGQNGSGYQACPTGKQYIVGLAPKYIPTLPTDPKLNDAVVNSGYIYTVNDAGTVYKMMVKNTVESETVNYTNEFKSCDASNSSIGVCDATYPSNNKPNYCEENNTQFQTSYAVWGGYPLEPFANIATREEEQQEKIICNLS